MAIQSGIPSRSIPKLHACCFTFLRFILFPCALLLASLSAIAMVAGDLAPRGNPDGVLDAADILVLQRILLGEIEPTAEEVLRADVAPLGAPDGELNAGDLVVLMRAVFGEITLPPISGALPDPPEFTAGGGFVSEGLYVLDGTAQPGATLNVYVNGVLYSSTTVSGNGTFSVEVTLTEGRTELYATVSDGLGSSEPSPTVVLEFAPEGRHVYHLVDPALADAPLRVVSLDDDNLLYVNGQSIPLARDQSYAIPAADLAPGAALWSEKPISLGGEAGGTDLPVPDAFAATEFVIPHHRDSHVYYLLSPYGDAEVVILRGGTTVVQALPRGEVVAFEAGNDNTLASVLYANRPILVSHKAFNGSTPRDAYPVPPPATELWGVRSNTAVVAALEDATTVWVYASNGSSNSYTLNAGAKQTLAVGVNGAQGTGNALHIVADKPVAAIQIADGDGIEATAFLGEDFLGVRFGIPVDSQYVAVVCPVAGTEVTLTDGATSVTESCSADGAHPGKAYFGSEVNGVHILAGAILKSTQPVYLIYEAAANDAERNLLGVPASLSPVPGKPSLDPLASPTQANPVTVTGSAEAGAEVRIYVNGVLGATGTADATTGAFSVAAPLLDGINTLEAASWNGQQESARSTPPVTVEYINEIPRTQSGNITQDTVWTPGVGGEPYVITGNLRVNPGVRLTLQPGVMLRFESGKVLTVDGELIVSGTADVPVTFTSNATDPKRGDWSGILVRTAAGILIEYAVIEWAVTGVEMVGELSGTVRKSTVREFLNNGIGISYAGSSEILLEGNMISNSAGVRAFTNCVHVQDSSPFIQGNRMSGCGTGIYIFRESSPTITDGNEITGNDYGLIVDGGGIRDPQPVVMGNQIYGNSRVSNTNNYIARNFTTNGSKHILYARNNWWGFGDATTIGATISDLTGRSTDSNRYPTVDYSNFLNGPHGEPVTGNYLIGPFVESSTSLDPDTVYEVLGTLYVPPGSSLTIPPGVVLRFHRRYATLMVDGTLVVAGTNTDPVVFTSGLSSPERLDWGGLLLRAEGSLIEHAVIEWATKGVEILGVAATIRETTVREFSQYGIYAHSAGSSVVLIEDNVIDNHAAGGGVSGSCIYVWHSSPSIMGNRVSGCDRGISISSSSSPTLTDNLITNNVTGIYVWGTGDDVTNPRPVINGNDLIGNGSVALSVLNFGSSSTLLIDATGNWWGSTSAPVIAALIHDYADDPANSPAVDYGGYLDGPGGESAVGPSLVGPFTVDTTLEAGVVYTVLSNLVVSSGVTLTIPAGVELRWPGNWGLYVDGALVVQGAESAPVTFTSDKANPNNSDWIGIRVRAGAGDVLIEHAVIEYAGYGVYFESTGEVRSSVIRNNGYGVYVYGNRNAVTDPKPIVRGNSIYSNYSYNYYASWFASPGSVRLDATGNWWGPTDPQVIAAKIYDYTDSPLYSPVVDFGGYLDGPGGELAVGATLTGPFTVDTSLEAGVVYTVLGRLEVPAGVTLTIPAGVELRWPAYWGLYVDGGLVVSGTSDAPVTFTSDESSPKMGDWIGIEVRQGATDVLIEYAVIEYAALGIYFNGSGMVGVVRNSFIHNNTYGIYIQGNSSPTLTGNLIAYNSIGINIQGTGDDLTNPRPVITGNDFIGNSSRALWVNNFGASSNLQVDATGNWWGTTVLSEIAAMITGAAWVDYSSPSTGPNNGLAVTSFTVSERYFSSNGDGVKDNTAAQIGFSEPADWTVRVRNSDAETVRTFTGSGTTAEVVWDGRDDGAQAVPEGEYRITVTATAGSRTLLPVGRPVTLDLTPPVAALSGWLDGAVLRNVLSAIIPGTALDAHFQEYRVDYGAGENPASWTQIESVKNQPVNNADLAQWIVNSTDGVVVLENGGYTLRLVVTDKAGNRSVSTTQLTIDNLYISEISTSTLTFDPMQDQSAVIQFTLNLPGTVYLRVYPEQGGGLIREISQSYTTAGTYSLAWDGRDANGDHVPDEAYALDLYATDGVRSNTYSPPSPDTHSFSFSLVEAGNTYQNRFWKGNATLTQPAMIQVSVTFSGGSFLAHNAPYEPGTHLILWDGRAPDGTILTDSRIVSVLVPVLFKPNAVIVKSVLPKLTGTGTVPHIEIKSNPYYVVHSYEQFSRVGYRVDQDSYVTVKLLPPGVAEPDHADAITLVDNELKSAMTDQIFDWRGHTVADTNKILVSEEGAYTYAIQATSVATGHQTLYRGVLNLYQ